MSRDFPNHKLTGISKVLRKNMTPEEKHLWYDFLKNLPITFNRQKVIGPYIVDFYCSSANLVIELDGSQHSTKQGLKNDAKRDEFLRNYGLTVLRFDNYDVLNYFDYVCKEILKYINTEK